MALETNLNFKGINIPGVYAKVTAFNGSKNSCAFHVGFFGPANEKGEREEISTSFYQNQNFALDGENPLKQAYALLKTLPEFAGAQDC